MSALESHAIVVRQPVQDDGGSPRSRDHESRGSVFSIDTPEDLVQFHRAEVDRLRQDANAPSRQLVSALLHLGTVLAEHPNLGDAEPPLREARERIDADNPAYYRVEVLVFVQTLAAVLEGRDEFDSAISLYATAVEDIQHSRGREHPWTSELQNNMGCLLTAAGMWHKDREQVDEARKCFDEAAVLFKRSYKAKSHVFGQSHRTTWMTRCNISMVSFLRGDPSGLETDLLAASKALKQLYSAKDADVKQIASHLASIYQRIGNHGRAVEISIEFGVDPNDDYKIHPFKDTLIPGLQILKRSTNLAPEPRATDQLPIYVLNQVLGILEPSWGKYAVQTLVFARDKIMKWTGMDVATFMRAVGFDSVLSEWGTVADKEVLLEQATAVGHSLAVELLLGKTRHRSDSEISEREHAFLGRSFHRAVESGNAEVVRLFLECGVKVTTTDGLGRPALHKAADLGLEGVLMELAHHIDDIDLRDGNGHTALDYALRGNHEAIIRFLMRRKGALLTSSKSTPDDSVVREKKDDKFTYTVVDEAFRTGLDASVVNFYIDREREVEEHRVWTYPVEAVVSDRNLLRNLLDDDGMTDGKPDFNWIHIPANNMYWVETLMASLADVSGDRERHLNFMTKEVWHNQLHESLHGSVHGRFMKPYCGSTGGAPDNRDIVLYMPYIHWESEPMKKEMDKEIEKVEDSLEFNTRTIRKIWKKARNGHDDDKTERKQNPQARLLQLYLMRIPGPGPLHVRRTFDQFQYYMNDDTTARDSDQVVSRYFQRRHEELTVPIMMVDQLWMWIVGGRTIVTSFPKRWDGSETTRATNSHILDTHNVLDSVLNQLKLKFREPILSIHDLADMIMARCLGLHPDSTQWENERHRYLEIFEHSINYVADEEIRRFSYFADGGKAGAKAKKKNKKSNTAGKGAETSEEDKKRKGRILLAALEAGLDIEETERILRPHKHWGIREEDMEEIFDISDEIELLKEIKDIRDEINILRTLFSQQSGVLRSYCLASGSRPRSIEMKSALSRLSGIVEKMDVDAQKPYKALEDLLDLKQKQANVAEARITRQSGTTITVFTIVTIVFLPASFMAAFFALPIVQFQFTDEMLQLWYVIKWVVAVTAVLAIPLIILALYVNKIMASAQMLGRILLVVARAAAKIGKAVFKGAYVLAECFVKSFSAIFWICLAVTLFICTRLGRISRWMRGYRRAKKEAKANGTEWSNRRYIIGGFLQKRLDRQEVTDEEKPRSRPVSRSRPRSSVTSRSASLVESSNGSRAQHERLSTGSGT